MSDDDVFDQTTKQNVSFLKAEAHIISGNILLSKASSYSFCRSNTVWPCIKRQSYYCTL